MLIEKNLLKHFKKLKLYRVSDIDLYHTMYNLYYRNESQTFNSEERFKGLNLLVKKNISSFQEIIKFFKVYFGPRDLNLHKKKRDKAHARLNF